MNTSQRPKPSFAFWRRKCFILKFLVLQVTGDSDFEFLWLEFWCCSCTGCGFTFNRFHDVTRRAGAAQTINWPMINSLCSNSTVGASELCWAPVGRVATHEKTPKHFRPRPGNHVTAKLDSTRRNLNIVCETIEGFLVLTSGLGKTSALVRSSCGIWAGYLEPILVSRD